MISLLLAILPLLSQISVLQSQDPGTVVSDTINVNEAEVLREQFRLMMEQRNRVGTTAADFGFVTRQGKDTTLHTLPTEKDIILIFYNPDCDDCHAAIDSISSMNTEGKFHVVAIDSEEDRDRWEATAQTLPEGWTVGFATDPIQDDDIYYILTMPTIYLLDKNKKVLLKDATVEETLRFHRQ